VSGLCSPFRWLISFISVISPLISHSALIYKALAIKEKWFNFIFDNINNSWEKTRVCGCQYLQLNLLSFRHLKHVEIRAHSQASSVAGHFPLFNCPIITPRPHSNAPPPPLYKMVKAPTKNRYMRTCCMISETLCACAYNFWCNWAEI
jgi:hypothetical protein